MEQECGNAQADKKCWYCGKEGFVEDRKLQHAGWEEIHPLCVDCRREPMLVCMKMVDEKRKEVK